MPSDLFERYGPCALVTGASSGIGEQLARALAAAGFDLVLVARRRELLERVASELRRDCGVAVDVVAADLARPDFLEPIERACAGKDVGLVASNAGFGLKGAHHEQARDRLTEMLAVNCHAPMLLAHAFAPRLIARGRGAIMLTGSIEGYVAFPYSTAYAASKAFVMSLGEGLWGELRSRGVDVLVLTPGATDTAAPTLQGIDRSQLVGVMAPSKVAHLALEALGRKPLLITGAGNRAFMAVLRALPRRVAARLTGAAMHTAIERSKRAKASAVRD